MEGNNKKGLQSCDARSAWQKKEQQIFTSRRAEYSQELNRLEEALLQTRKTYQANQQAMHSFSPKEANIFYDA